MRFLSLIALSLVALLGVTFAVLNAQIVTVNYYLGTRDLPLSLLLVGVFILGIFLGILIVVPSLLKKRFEIRRLKRELKP